MNKNIIEGRRWSGLDWADQQREILLIGVGSIGSWLMLSLSRICHKITCFDGDIIDNTNVEGGQLYRTKDIGAFKVDALTNICTEFGCINGIMPINIKYTADQGMEDICILGLDNMKSRKEAFEAWEQRINYLASEYSSLEECLFIDGRMNAELFEIFTVQATNEDQIREYKEKHLFDDSDSPDLECTQKSTTFCAMGIASMITATLCNWLTNKKLGEELRKVPFYQRFFYPLLCYQEKEVEKIDLVVL